MDDRRWRAESFFDLSSFAHSRLFEEGAVWEALKRLEAYLSGVLRPGIHPSARIHSGAILIGDQIEIGERCVVEPGAFIRGPVILGPGCEVRHGAYLRGNIVAGSNCVLGHASEFKNCILLDSAKAPHFNYVGDSILGARVNMGAGSKLSNVKVLHGSVRVQAGKERVDTALRKFGAVLGDGVEIGCNAVLNPGTVLGPGCAVYPNASVRGYHPPGRILKLRQVMEEQAMEEHAMEEHAMDESGA